MPKIPSSVAGGGAPIAPWFKGESGQTRVQSVGPDGERIDLHTSEASPEGVVTVDDGAESAYCWGRNGHFYAFRGTPGENTGWVDLGAGGPGGSSLTTDDQELPALATVSDEDPALASGISATPDGRVGVVVNGHAVPVGDGTKAAPCYFSGDGGTTPRALSAVQATDTLHWVGSVAGFQLDTNDRISLVYEV